MSTEEFQYSHLSAQVFTSEIMARSGQDITSCYQCKRCAAGCPVAEQTDMVTPNRLIRMVILGDIEQALTNQLTWKCLFCHTCGTRCPNNIKTGRVADTLKKMALDAGLDPQNPEYKNFHKAFFNHSLRWGKINEIGMMGEYELRNIWDTMKKRKVRKIISHMKARSQFAWEMFRQKRLHLSFHSSKGRDEISRLYKKSAGRKWI
ncbi:MAG: 4Fe-4S dicluster domain-containing protein [Desulfobulbaceae bacterium]|nr:4Fe-4S dicluster domain-containing protein [Desulfobulbaceae bacterium]